VRKAKHAATTRVSRAGLVVAVAVLVLGGAAAWAFVPRHDRHVVASPGSAPPSAPVSTMAASPSAPSPTPTPTRGRLIVHAAGDVSLDPGFISTYRTMGYAYAWSGLGGLFRRDDLTIVNLECAVTNAGSPVPKEFNFRGDPAALGAMRRAGVDVASMANNHSYDFGPAGLMDTRTNIRTTGMAAVGAGRDPKQALAPALFTIDGWRVAVLGFDKVVDPWPEAVAAPGHPGTAAGHDEDAMVSAVKAAAKVSDLVFVMIHWGVELDTQPRAADVALGHRMIAAGADAIFGGHSHRLQLMEIYRGRPIFYSLGNFVWINHSVAGSTTAVAEVRVRPTGRVSGRLIPAVIEAPGHPVLGSR